MNGNVKCANCVFSERVSASGPLRCRRHAPIPSELGNPMASHWPTVGANDWCGEWMDEAGRQAIDVICQPRYLATLEATAG